MTIDPKFTAPVSSSIVTETVENTLQLVNGSNLAFTLCDRTEFDDNKSNYFISLNLPYQQSEFATGSSMSMLYPELQQLNVDQVIIAPIPPAFYNEFIDGRTIKLNIPQKGGASQANMSAVTIVSSTYTGSVPLQSESNPLLGDNVVFLFADAINTPYSGDTVDEIGNIISHSGNNTWEPNPLNTFLRPSAVPYSAVKYYVELSGTSSDQRTNANYSVPVGSAYPDNRPGYNYDIPVGFMVLDKGIFCITDTTLVSNFPWTSGFTQSNNAPYTGVDVGSKTNIYFTGVTASNSDAAQLIFDDVTTTFQNSAVCIAMPGQFWNSNNPTFPRALLNSSVNGQNIVNIQPVYVTEIGLYNSLSELVAVAKLDRPVEKNYTNVVTFYIDIEM